MRFPPLLVLAPVALVLAACGGNGDDAVPPATTAPDEPADATQPLTPAAAPGPCADEPVIDEGVDPNLVLRVQHGQLRAGGDPRWLLTVTNEGTEPVELAFRSGQDGDVALHDRAGNEVYRWSEEMAFTQALRCQVVEPGQVASSVLGGELDVAPGQYRLTATYVSTPAPEPVETDVTVE